MKLKLPHSRKAIFEATATTILLSACIHLIVALCSSLITRRIDYINPIDFLGLGLIAPHLRDSGLAAFLGWAFLIGAGYTILRLDIHLRITVAIRRRKARVARPVALEGEEADI